MRSPAGAKAKEGKGDPEYRLLLVCPDPGPSVRKEQRDAYRVWFCFTL